MPSAWWCTYDSGTLKNGATLLPVLATFTNVEGKIQTAFLDARSHGKRYDAQATSELVHRTVTDHLNPDALIGVLLDGVVPERTQRRFRTRPRWLLLTTIPTDGKELASGRLLAQRVNPGAVPVWEWLHRGNAVGARTLKIRTATGRAKILRAPTASRAPHPVRPVTKVHRRQLSGTMQLDWRRSCVISLTSCSRWARVVSTTPRRWLSTASNRGQLRGLAPPDS